MNFPFKTKSRRLIEAQAQIIRYFEAKESLIGPLSAYLKGELGINAGTPQQQIDESYSSVIYYYACVNLIAESAASIPLELFQTKNDEKVSEHNVLTLLTKRPNQYQSATELREFFHAVLHITGNAYLMCDKAEVSGNTLFIRNVLPANISLESTRDPLNPIIYQITDNYGVRRPYPKNKIIHWKKFNPSSELEGLSPVSVARMTIDSLNMSRKWNNSLKRNKTVPPGMFTAEGSLSDEQYKRFRKDVEKSAGYLSAGKPLIGDMGMKYIPFSLSPADMEWLQDMKLSMREVCALLKVPSELLGDPDSKTYANAKEARAALYEFTETPLVNRECALYNQFFFPDGDLQLRPDLSLIDAMKENENERILALRSADFLTPNEKRLALGYEALPDEAADKLYLYVGQVPLDVAALGSGAEGEL